MTKSALEELLAAASKDLAANARYSDARVELDAMSIDMAQELIDRRSAGQALAEALEGQEQVWRDANECEGCLVYVAFCESHALAFTLARSKAVDAAADWNALGEAEEGRDATA